jgi:hypothetical protein
MAQEVSAIKVPKPEANVGPCLSRLSLLTDGILSWFHKKLTTEELLERVNGLTAEFAMLEPWTQATFVARLKQEQSNLRRTLVRINTIRETSFVSAGYLLADIITFLLCTGLVLVSMDPFHESVIFAGVISYLLVFLLTLIRDLDNPFGYYERFSGADVSLQPLQDTARRLATLAGMEADPSGDAGR